MLGRDRDDVRSRVTLSTAEHSNSNYRFYKVLVALRCIVEAVAEKKIKIWLSR